MNDIEFLHPNFLYLLLLIPLIIVWHVWQRNKQQASLSISTTSAFTNGQKSFIPKLRPLLIVFRVTAFALITVALARPRTTDISSKTKKSEGIDIILAMDVSTSMDARDFKPNRLEASKDVAIDFIEGRPSDRIGVVVYAAESFTQTPLTTDHKIVKNSIKDIRFGLIEDGTAIGMGLATAVNRLKESKAKSKVIILLTDGENNRGQIDPVTAAEIAKQFNIRTYTIGVGTKGKAPFPTKDFFGRDVLVDVEVNIDEDLLKKIADMTGGKYFRATNQEKYEAIYEEINELEKTILEELKYYNYDEKYGLLVLIAGGLLFLEMLLKYTVFRSFI